MISVSVSGLLQAAGHYPLFQAAAIIIGTFILEDAATVLAAMQAEEGSIAVPVALGALYCGIVLGDLGLYGLGFAASRWTWARRWLPDQRRGDSRLWVEKHVFKVVFVSRFIPGARLPAFTTCGYLGASFPRFALAAILATLVWTTMLFLVSMHVGRFLLDHFGAWRWAGLAVFAVAIVLIGRLLARLRRA